MSGIGDKLGERILTMFTDWLIELVIIFINFLENTLFNYEGLGGYALEAYQLFVYFGGILLVTVALGKVITQILSEAEGSQEADVWWTIVQSFKAGSLLVIMPLVITTTMNYVVKPIGNYFVGGVGQLSVDLITDMSESADFKEAFDGSMGLIVIWLFVLIVLGFFVVKMFVAQAQLLMAEILSPLVAISVVTDDYNFMDTWWKDILSHVATLITLSLSMLLFVEALSLPDDVIWTKLPAIIGSGALVVSGPTIIKNLWFSSGAGRSGMGMARTALNYTMYKR